MRVRTGLLIVLGLIVVSGLGFWLIRSRNPAPPATIAVAPPPAPAPEAPPPEPTTAPPPAAATAPDAGTGTPDNPGQPAGNKTDHQYDQKTFICNMHGGASLAAPVGWSLHLNIPAAYRPA